MAFFGGGAKSASTDSIYDIKVETIDGKTISMDKFKVSWSVAEEDFFLQKAVEEVIFIFEIPALYTPKKTYLSYHPTILTTTPSFCSSSGQSVVDCQRCLRMWLHPPIPGIRRAVRQIQGQRV